MQKPLILSLMVLMTSACSFPGVYKITVAQGNIVNPEMVEQLRPGMTREQVYFVMGHPLIEHTFDKTVDSYVYTIQVDGGETRSQVINIHYKDDLYSHFSGELRDKASLRPANIRKEQKTGRKHTDDA